MSSDDYIIITESRNMGDDKGDTEGIQDEEVDSSRRALEGQGIFLDQENGEAMNLKPHDEFSKELKEVGGIEIITSGEGQ
ncbi:MAG: hypothetical protein HZB12_02580 [Candidatus Yonathbacteria bacterium]|nr:hypothetical protein [Candidatus Yonathbacteria bacterium]